jgi:hypothetical protein
MVKRVPAVSQICRHRPVGHWPNSRFDGKYSRISARKRTLAVETAADIKALRENSRGIANGNSGAPNRELFPSNREFICPNRELRVTSNPPDLRALSPIRQHLCCPPHRRAIRLPPLPWAALATSPIKPSYTANWAILPLPCSVPGR